SIAALAASPVDSYGVGTRVVTGSGQPTAGMVYKLVARQDGAGDWIPVAKASADKTSTGGRKHAERALRAGRAYQERVSVMPGSGPADAVPPAGEELRALQVPLVVEGDPVTEAEGP